MPREFYDIGSSPSEEECAQLGREGYARQARQECHRLIRQLRKELGEEPGTARLAVKANSHDFGTYYSVVCYFDTFDPEGEAYAGKCEDELPAHWDPEVPELSQVEAGT
jgi:hypothetical protein